LQITPKSYVRKFIFRFISSGFYFDRVVIQDLIITRSCKKGGFFIKKNRFDSAKNVSFIRGFDADNTYISQVYFQTIGFKFEIALQERERQIVLLLVQLERGLSRF